MEEPSISMQVTYGSIGVVARVDTPYSPDVFDTCVNKCVSAVLRLLDSNQGEPSEVAGDGYENFVAYMEAKLQDDD